MANADLIEPTTKIMPEPTALIILAEGAEEMEAVITADVLRRGGIKVTYAGLLSASPVKCARGTVIVPDAGLSQLEGTLFDALILPGGQPGSNTLAASEAVGSILAHHQRENRLIAAICAAPIALKSHGVEVGSLTSHPSVRKQLEEAGYSYSEDRVVVSGKVITSRGPGTAFEFALKIVELLTDSEKAQSLVPPMLLISRFVHQP